MGCYFFLPISWHWTQMSGNHVNPTHGKIYQIICLDVATPQTNRWAQFNRPIQLICPGKQTSFPVNSRAMILLHQTCKVQLPRGRLETVSVLLSLSESGGWDLVLFLPPTDFLTLFNSPHFFQPQSSHV